MTIRPTATADWNEVLAIYAYAREQMRRNGNPFQWGTDRPSEASIRQDIEAGNHYVVNHDGQIVGVFSFVLGDDPTYRLIEGEWLNNAPYGALHKIASNGAAKGILRFVLDHCESRIANVRVDTHRDNAIMRHLLQKYGYRECGVIYVDDGTPRMAYHKEIK